MLLSDMDQMGQKIDNPQQIQNNSAPCKQRQDSPDQKTFLNEQGG